MTEQEKQVQLQLLKAEMLQKTNKVNREKDALMVAKNRKLKEEGDNYCGQKRTLVSYLDEVRTKKKEYAMGTEGRCNLEDEARNIEQRLSMLRTEHERHIHDVSVEYNERLVELKDRQMRLDEWYENEKAFIMSRRDEE